MKIVIRILLVLALILGITGALAYDAFYSAPTRFTVRYETLASTAIPEQMDDISILFFSDLDYNRFMKEERFAKLIRVINGLSPDVVIFGGDIFDQDAQPVTEEVYNQVVSGLKSIQAPLGKFAVLGDLDEVNLVTKNQSKNILYEADFEVLENQSISLRNEGSQAIYLVGLDNEITGYLNVSQAYQNVSRAGYTITVCHTPDTADDVPTDTTKYFLAGHSHGGQANWYFGSLYLPEKGASNYLLGKHRIDEAFTLDITNGVGTTIKDVRFLANAEVVLYRLVHQEETIEDTPTY
ncbi:MAG: metallophosphoesterase [Solobacterium sp.]|nr:metallophosphoesterase [Solobacterium sp.]